MSKNDKLYKYLSIVGVILFQIYLLWQYRNHIMIDYQFITKQTSNIKGQILYIDITIGNYEKNEKVYEYDIYNYHYFIEVEGKAYPNTESSLDLIYKSRHSKEKRTIDIEYINENPNINRIINFTEVKDSFDFFKEYFMYKLLAILLVLLFNYHVEHSKIKKENY